MRRSSGGRAASRLLRLIRCGETARDLMAPNPVSIDQRATVGDAAALLTRAGVGAAPVVSTAGRPVGVVGWADIARHEQETARRLSAQDRHGRGRPARPPATALGRHFLWELAAGANVREIMTPYALCVQPDTPLVKVVEVMLARHTYRLFVADEDGILVGAVCALDVLRQLRR